MSGTTSVVINGYDCGAGTDHELGECPWCETYEQDTRNLMPNPTAWEQTVDRYFDTWNTWGSVRYIARKVGSLAERVEDPTFGDDSIGLAADVFECKVCAAVVIDWEKHIRWHEGTP